MEALIPLISAAIPVVIFVLTAWRRIQSRQRPRFGQLLLLAVLLAAALPIAGAYMHIAILDARGVRYVEGVAIVTTFAIGLSLVAIGISWAVLSFISRRRNPDLTGS